VKLAMLLACALPVFAAIDGTVINRTTGKPQAGVTVSMTKLDQSGMAAAGSAKSGLDGKFRIETDAAAAHLLQAVYQGVTYNMQLPPGTPASGLQVAVYDSLPKVSAAQMSQHMILLETDGQELVVNETLIYQNDSQTTWYDPKGGTLRFAVPEAAGTNIMARATAPGGMPVERAPKKTGVQGEYLFDYPVKPGGETRFDISYKLPVKTPMELSGKVLHEPGPVRLVVPQGITVGGEGLTPLGTEPQTQAMIYEVKGASYKLTISGTGSLKSTSAAPAATEREEDGPRIEQIMPPGYQRQWKWVLGLIVAFLALSFWAQWIKTPRAQGGKPKA